MERNEPQPSDEPLAIERLSVDEFLALRHKFAENGDRLLIALDEELPTLVERDSTRAIEFIEALTKSEVKSDRDCAAVSVGNLFAVNREHAMAILFALLGDEDADVRDQAFQTLDLRFDAKELSLIEAVPLAQAYLTAKKRENTEEPPEVRFTKRGRR